MKTLVLTSALFMLTALGINQSAYAAKPAHEQITVLTEIKNISKIEVYGNVELYISNGASDQVKVYNDYYKETALVQDHSGVLRISSYKAEKLVVWVTVSDLRALSVSDNSEVKSFGRFSAIDLDVKVNNNASAQLDLDVYHANITLSGQAKANISGSIEQGSFVYDRSASLNTYNLAADHITRKINADGTENHYTSL